MKAVYLLLIAGVLAVVISGINGADFFRAVAPAGVTRLDTDSAEEAAIAQTTPIFNREDAVVEMNPSVAKHDVMQSSNQDEPGQEDGSIQEMVNLRLELASLKDDMKIMQQQLEEQSRLQLDAIVLATTSTNSLQDDIGRIGDIARIEIERRQEERLAVMEQVLESELVDESWAGEAVEIIELALDGQISTLASIENVDCRFTLCRVDAFLKEGMEYSEFVLLLRSEMTGKFSQMLFDQTEVESSGRMVIYLSRNDYM